MARNNVRSQLTKEQVHTTSLINLTEDNTRKIFHNDKNNMQIEADKEKVHRKVNFKNLDRWSFNESPTIRNSRKDSLKNIDREIPFLVARRRFDVLSNNKRIRSFSNEEYNIEINDKDNEIIIENIGKPIKSDLLEIETNGGLKSIISDKEIILTEKQNTDILDTEKYYVSQNTLNIKSFLNQDDTASNENCNTIKVEEIKDSELLKNDKLDEIQLKKCIANKSKLKSFSNQEHIYEIVDNQTDKIIEENLKFERLESIPEDHLMLEDGTILNLTIEELYNIKLHENTSTSTFDDNVNKRNNNEIKYPNRSSGFDMGHNLQKERVEVYPIPNKKLKNDASRESKLARMLSDDNSNKIITPAGINANVSSVEQSDTENINDYEELKSDTVTFNELYSLTTISPDESIIELQFSERSKDSEPIYEEPVPPPTLPKYTSSFNAGSNLGLRDREKEGIGGSYRLASLDRLALRQRLIDQNNTAASPQTTMSNGNSTAINGNETNGTTAPPPANSIQSKREMFFKSDTTITNTTLNTQATHSVNDVKDALAKKAAESQEINKISRVTVSERTIPEPQNKVAMTEAQKSAPEPVKEKPKPRELDGYVGFANLPNQVYRKAVKRGFEFTLMVVGESGLGKSTLINSMFLTDIYESGSGAEFPGPSLRIKKTVSVETSRVLLKENGVNLTLTVVDTPGFGDAVDNSNCWNPIIDYIDNKYEEYLNSESRVERSRPGVFSDARVHCCLYFVRPSGHGLRPLDVECMRRLCERVNVIPVLAKADTMTPEECAHFKKQVLDEIARHGIKIYEFPDTPDAVEASDEEAKLNRTLKSKVPFAVVGSNAVIEVDGKKIRGRKYPWGIAEVENLEHCDFIALRNMVIRTHLQDLKDVTNNVHYENYRVRKLAGLGADGKPARNSNKNPLAQMEEEKREHDIKMKKMEVEMEQVFEMKVKEKKQKLKDSENELARRCEQTRKQLEVQAKELEEKRKQFEAEKSLWERDNNVSLDELRRRSLEANSKEAVDGKEKKDKKKKGLF